MHHALRGMLLLQLFVELLHEISMGLVMSQSKYDEYAAVRHAYYQALPLHLVQTLGLNADATSIDYRALEQVADWEGRRYGWSWFDVKQKFRNIPSRFELALVCQDEVCALAIGKPSRGRSHLPAYFFEGNPKPDHPIKGHALATLIESASFYGLALDCLNLRLVDSVQGLHSRYLEFGFKFGKNSLGRV